MPESGEADPTIGTVSDFPSKNRPQEKKVKEAQVEKTLKRRDQTWESVRGGAEGGEEGVGK